MQQPLYPQELKCLGRVYALFAIKKMQQPIYPQELRWLGAGELRRTRMAAPTRNSAPPGKFYKLT
jgi:hypothetical protein